MGAPAPFATAAINRICIWRVYSRLASPDFFELIEICQRFYAYGKGL